MKPISEIMFDSAEKHGVTIRCMRDPCRKQKFVVARRWAARIMYEEGWSITEIATALNRSRSTVLNLIHNQPVCAVR